MNYCSEPQILKAGQKESDIAYFLIEQNIYDPPMLT